jgi:hypothetical protein
MTQQEKQIKLAEAAGYKPKPDHYWYSSDDNRTFRCYGCCMEQSWREFCDNKQTHPPGPCANNNGEDYFGDLNAVAGLRTLLASDAQRVHFGDLLKVSIGCYGDSYLTGAALYDLACIPADLQSEALGITLGLWKEGE